MEKMIPFVLFFGIASSVIGEVSTKVCLSDGNTPLELVDPNVPFVYRDVMDGTKLAVIVDSNLAEYWWGGVLGVEEENMINIGRLYGRGCKFGECPGSCLPAAGEWAYVWETVSYGIGFEFYGGEEPDVGDWFIFDYNALDIGDCNVAFYDFDVSDIEPVHTLIFHHVRTRDFNENTKVDFADFAVLASYWQMTDCNDPNWCEGTDLDVNGSVDANDLRLFCEYWLEKTE